MDTEHASQLLGLPQAAEKLGITRFRAGELVRAGVIPATRMSGRWFISEDELVTFAETFQPPVVVSRPRPSRTQRTRSEGTRSAIARLLRDWHDATAEELAVSIDLHPGNVRKHLALMELAGHTSRDAKGTWSLTPSGQERYLTPTCPPQEAHRAS